MGKENRKKEALNNRPNQPHPRPLSEPTVTDQREVMERGVNSAV